MGNTINSGMIFARLRSVLQIRTIPEGYNSGRAYYIRAESSACQNMVTDLEKLAQAARVLAEKRTRFEKNQLQVLLWARRRARHRCLATFCSARWRRPMLLCVSQ